MPIGEVLQMRKKYVIFYLGRVPRYFFFILKRDFHYVGMTDQENNTSTRTAKLLPDANNLVNWESMGT